MHGGLLCELKRSAALSRSKLVPLPLGSKATPEALLSGISILKSDSDSHRRQAVCKRAVRGRAFVQTSSAVLREYDKLARQYAAKGGAPL
jgi:hypothetical protein